MTADVSTDRDTFLAALWEHNGRLDEQDPLKKVRTRAWDRFLELGVPDRKTEVFRYIPLHKLFCRPFTLKTSSTLSNIEESILPECPQSVIVFVNGTFRPDLSKTYALPNKVVLTTLADAMKTYGSFLNNQWARSIKEEQDPFANLNMSLHSEGAFLYIPPKTIFDIPVQILNIVEEGFNGWAMPRLQVFVGSQSEVKLHITHDIKTPASYVVNNVVEFAIEDNAHVNVTQTSRRTGSEAWLMEALRATLKRNSSFKCVNVTSGSQTTRHDYRVALAGEGSEALLNGLWMLQGSNEAHIHVLVEHQAPHCHSNQFFKGVLTDKSRSSFEGKIYVFEEAQKTEAYQLNQNLVLSDDAIAYSKPNLEIFADDVKASHGATVGQLEPEELFYLRTRGFSSTEAKNLLIASFCREVTDMLLLPSLQAEKAEQIKRLITES